MRLLVTTPTAVVANVADVAHVRAEDATGAFGIAPGHADFVTVLPISVVTWRGGVGGGHGREGFVLVQGGVLTVQGGTLVEIAARAAWRQETLADLGPAALAELRRAGSDEDVARNTETRMHLAVMRQVARVLAADRPAVPDRAIRDRRAQQAAAAGAGGGERS